MGGLLLLAREASFSANVSILDPAAPPAEAIRNLSVLVFAITGFIFLVVEGVFLYCVIRFPRRPSTPEAEPPQVYGSMPIEVAWTVAPTLIVFVLILVNARTLWEVKLTPPVPQPGDNALFVTVIGRQWWWEYRYSHYNGRKLGPVVTANELHIPASDAKTRRRVYLTLESADVCHSFWVPRLAGKTDLIPGRVNSMWLEPTEPALYLGQCAEYCGTQHAHMLLRVIVDRPSDFERWLKNEARPARDERAARKGRDVFLTQSCVNCHRIRGTRARGTYAPDLTHLMSRATLASGMIANDPEGTNLRKWVADPQVIKPGCLMPAFGLSRRDLDLVVNYLRTLR
jgi:cytochrome c oxidase subunit 2